MPHLNYMLLAWDTKCHKIELLQKRAIRLLYYYTGRFIKNQQKYAKTNTVIYKCMEK